MNHMYSGNGVANLAEQIDINIYYGYSQYMQRDFQRH